MSAKLASSSRARQVGRGERAGRGRDRGAPAAGGHHPRARRFSPADAGLAAEERARRAAAATTTTTRMTRRTTEDDDDEEEDDTRTPSASTALFYISTARSRAYIGAGGGERVGELPEAEARLIESFMAASAERRGAADMIMEKIQEKEATADPTAASAIVAGDDDEVARGALPAAGARAVTRRWRRACCGQTYDGAQAALRRQGPARARLLAGRALASAPRRVVAA